MSQEDKDYLNLDLPPELYGEILKNFNIPEAIRTLAFVNKQGREVSTQLVNKKMEEIGKTFEERVKQIEAGIEDAKATGKYNEYMESQAYSFLYEVTALEAVAGGYLPLLWRKMTNNPEDIAFNQRLAHAVSDLLKHDNRIESTLKRAEGLSDVSNQTIEKADIKKNLYGAQLRDCSFKGVDLSSADLRNADLRDAKLNEADLRNANMQGADARGANFEGADLQNANMQNAYLRGTNLYGANPEGTNFEGSDLQNANLSENLDDFMNWESAEQRSLYESRSSALKNMVRNSAVPNKDNTVEQEKRADLSKEEPLSNDKFVDDFGSGSFYDESYEESYEDSHDLGWSDDESESSDDERGYDRWETTSGKNSESPPSLSGRFNLKQEENQQDKKDIKGEDKSPDSPAMKR